MLTVIVLSGLLLLSANLDTDLQSTLFWIKAMLAVTPLMERAFVVSAAGCAAATVQL